MTRAVPVLVTLLAAALFVSGCASCDPDESVSVRIVAEGSLNTYDGEPHKMDLYFFKLSDAGAFQGTPVSQLKGSNPSAPGAIFLGRKNISPGESVLHVLGPMASEIYTHIGVVGAYRQPGGTQKMVAEIPSGCGLQLVAGPNAIVAFEGK